MTVGVGVGVAVGGAGEAAAGREVVQHGAGRLLLAWAACRSMKMKPGKVVTDDDHRVSLVRWT